MQQSPQVIVIQPVNPQVVYVPCITPQSSTGIPTWFRHTLRSASRRCRGRGVWSWHRGRRDDEQFLRLGIQQLGLWMARHHGGGLPRRHILREQCLARWVLWFQRVRLWSLRRRPASTGYNPSTGTYARGATVSNGYGSASAGQAYNPHTGASASTVQGSNAYGSYGASTASKDGTTVDSQHQTNANGTTGQMHSSNGASAYGATGKYGNSAAVGETANGNKYAAADGKTYSNTGSGWDQKSGSPSSYNKSSSSGWGGEGKERRVVGFQQWRRRMELEGIQCSW